MYVTKGRLVAKVGCKFGGGVAGFLPSRGGLDGADADRVAREVAGFHPPI